jgi:hypothetical protein
MIATSNNIRLILLEDSSDIGLFVNRYLAWSLGDANIEEFFSWTHVFDFKLLTAREFDVGYYCDVS